MTNRIRAPDDRVWRLCKQEWSAATHRIRAPDDRVWRLCKEQIFFGDPTGVFRGPGRRQVFFGDPTGIFRGPGREGMITESVCGASGRGALSCKPKRRTTKTQYPRVRLRKRSVPEWCADRAHGSVHVLTCPRSRKSKHNTTLTRCPTLYKRKVTAALWVNAAPFLSHSLRACTSDASSRNRRAARLTVEMHAYTGPMPPHIWRVHARFSRHSSYPTRASRIISDCEQ